MSVVRSLGLSTVAALQPGNWITVSGDDWAGGASTALYRATAPGSVTFFGGWHTGSGTTGEYVYCNVTAYKLGRQ